MRIWSNVNGKDTPFDIVEGSPVVLRYYGDVRFGKFVKLDTVGHGRWKHTELFARSPSGEIFSGPLFWFEPVTANDMTAFNALPWMQDDTE